MQGYAGGEASWQPEPQQLDPEVAMQRQLRAEQDAAFRESLQVLAPLARGASSSDVRTSWSSAGWLRAGLTVHLWRALGSLCTRG